MAAVLAISSQASAQLVVSQVYGDAVAAGPNGDYVEIFNNSCASINLDGYSVQVAAATGTAWSVVPLPNFVLASGQYYLIKLTNTAAGTVILTPDLTAAPVITTLTLTSGKVAIVRGDQPVSLIDTIVPTNACPNSALIVDFVRYANVASVACTEGLSMNTTGAAAGTGIARGLAGCTDTNVNSADFAVTGVGPVLRNSSDPVNVCPGALIVGACNLSNGGCEMTTEGACDTLGGSYLGDCSACDALGSCCVAGGCTITIQSACTGIWTAGQSCGFNSYALSTIPSNFVDISATGTILPGIAAASDDGAAQIQLPFPVSFYGVTKTAASVGVNGFISFNAAATQFTNASIPAAAAPNDAIYPMWDDLIFRAATQHIRTQTNGAIGSRVFIIQWTDIPQRVAVGASSNTFQIQLFEDTSCIELHYSVVDGVENPATDTNGTTVGVENITGTAATQLAIPNATECRASLAALVANAQGLRFCTTSASCVVGACCSYAPNACAEVLSSECSANGGVFIGPGTTCASNPCPGACCRPDGSCAVLTIAACQALGTGAVFAGDLACPPAVACAPAGACCLTDGACSILNQVACEASPNFYRWTEGATCVPNLCLGRCCATDGSCTITIAPNCVAPNRFGGDGTTCADVREFSNPTPPTVAIPSSGAAPLSVINVPDSFLIQDVDVRVKIQHTWRSDINICLTGPGGSPTVALTLSPTCITGGNCGSEDNYNVIYNDEGAAIVCASANIANLAATPDQVIPGQALSAFDGLTASGDWTLAIVDDTAGDSGTLLEWSLLLDNGQACIGACCTGLACTRVSSDACALAGGVYQGDATSCTPSPCAPNGACCLAAGCSIQAEADCLTAGGVYGGDTTTCANPAPCQAPCCKSDGTCDLRTLVSCNGLTGAVAGTLGTSCPANPCAPTGACCAADGTCTAPVTEVGCTAAGGVRWTAGVACTPNLCQGRCCSADGSVCAVKFPPGTPGGNACDAPEVYGGDGTTCAGINPCQGRCCAPDGTCTTTIAAACVAPNTFGGLGTDCSNPDLCKGRCCQSDGTCTLEGPDTCVAPDVFGGVGTNCDNAVCTGRCCLANGTCSVTSIDGCAQISGVFSLGLDCTSVTVNTFDNIGLAIPEGPGGATVTNVQVLAGLPSPLSDVDIDIKINHTFFADLILKVEHNGVIVDLTDGTAACFGDNPDVVLDDEGTGGAMDTIACGTTVPPSPPNYTPLSPLTAFDGMDPNGPWTISIKDDANLDTGTLIRWSVHVTTDAPVCPVVGCTCFGDMNGDTLVDGQDVAGFSACVIAGGGPGCACADMDHVGGVTTSDIPGFISALLAGGCGP